MSASHRTHITEAACPDCPPLDRRVFLKTVGGAALLGVSVPSLVGTRAAWGAPTADSAAETSVARFYNSLSEEQRKAICFPFEHELRQKISANWHITKTLISDDFYSKDQRANIEEIVKKVTSEDGYRRIVRQTEEDSAGLGDYSVAVFGTPGSGKFQWELTGRHLTLRADGNSVDKAAFGGPIIYGHGAANPKENVFHYQTLKANEVFKALDAKQAEKALIANEPRESDVLIQGTGGRFPGIAVGELSSDQKALVEATLKTLLDPYRKEDVDEVFEILKASGGVESLHMAFYQQGDLGNDRLWDVWRVEGPSFVWHFRGAPHVHAYINIGIKA